MADLDAQYGNPTEGLDAGVNDPMPEGRTDIDTVYGDMGDNTPDAVQAAEDRNPISETEIENCDDPVVRDQMKQQLAQQVAKTYATQIEQKQAYEKDVEKADETWPHQTGYEPVDKRTESGVSRPYDVQRAAYGDASIN